MTKCLLWDGGEEREGGHVMRRGGQVDCALVTHKEPEREDEGKAPYPQPPSFLFVMAEECAFPSSLHL